jgi:hypothetical protein
MAHAAKAATERRCDLERQVPAEAKVLGEGRKRGLRTSETAAEEIGRQLPSIHALAHLALLAAFDF